MTVKLVTSPSPTTKRMSTAALAALTICPLLSRLTSKNCRFWRTRKRRIGGSRNRSMVIQIRVQWPCNWTNNRKSNWRRTSKRPSSITQTSAAIWHFAARHTKIKQKKAKAFHRRWTTSWTSRCRLQSERRNSASRTSWSSTANKHLKNWWIASWISRRRFRKIRNSKSSWKRPKFWRIHSSHQNIWTNTNHSTSIPSRAKPNMPTKWTIHTKWISNYFSREV